MSKINNSKLIAEAKQMRGDFATNLHKLKEKEDMKNSRWQNIKEKIKKFLADIGEAAAWAIKR